jgi:hypothetical protein
MKNTLRGEYSQLSEDIVKFTNLSKNKINPEEIEEQKEIISQVKNIVPKYKQISMGIVQNENLPSDSAITTDDFLIGKTGTYANKNKQQAITSEQKQVMIEIDDETKFQYEILDKISAELEDLKQLSNTINDTVKAQNEMLDVVIDKTEHTNTSISNVSDKTKDLVKKINSKSTKLCAYIICSVILLALCLFIYNMIK